MDLSHPTACLIKNALYKSNIDITHYVHDKKFIDDIQEKSDIFYRISSDNRSKSEVFEDVFNGEICERALVDMCITYNLTTYHNNEINTKEFYWDVNVEQCKIEVKYQKYGHSYFSFYNEKSEGCLYSHWNYYDLIIAFYIRHSNERMYAVPWVMIDNKAIDPLRLNNKGEQFYRSSNYGGRYLHWSAERAGLAIKLNKMED